MEKWQDIKIQGIARIEKMVAEFDVIELEKTPYAKFKVKIYESPDSTFTGYTNLRVKDENGNVSGGVGHGATIEEALKDTIEYFLKILEGRESWEEANFEYSDIFDF